MSTKLHTGLYVIISALLFLIIYHFLQAEPGLSRTIQNSGWSEPETLFVLPDATDGVRSLTASVNGEKLTLTANLIRRTPDFNALGLSYIAKIESDMVNPTEGTLTILSDTAYVAEGPTFLYHNKGEEHNPWHVVWGERREDPNFELWQWQFFRVNRFSTTLVYRSADMDEISPPVVLHDAGLSISGLGTLRPAQFFIKDDMEGGLHVVLQTWLSDEFRGGEASYITYIRKQPGQPWEEPVFPVVNEIGLPDGIDPDIETLQGGRILLSYIASSGEQGQTINNDLLIMSSDDQGNNWNAPESMFISERQPVLMQRIYRDAEGRVHLLWGIDHGGLPVVNEVWHRYSNDNGVTWSSPEPFMIMSDFSNDPGAGILEYDITSDSMGCLHWSARVYQPDSGIEGAPGLYSRWCSSDDSWEQIEQLDFIRDLSFTAAADNETSEIYLIWADSNEEGRQAIFYSKKSLLPVEVPPVLAESGPLQLHRNYPNPFSASTTAPFTLEEEGEVMVLVYDVGGRRILQQDLGVRPAGFHTHELELSGVPSGTYVYEIVLNNSWRQQNTITVVK